MTKDELIARLQVLGEQLNRDVSLTLPVRTHLSARKMC